MSATLYTTVGGNCMHVSSDCDVLRYSQPKARTLCKRCQKELDGGRGVPW